MMTKEKLLERQGVHIGFFYLRALGEIGSGRKVAVFVKGDEINVWNGEDWRKYAEYEPDPVVDARIAKCNIGRIL